MDGYRQTKVRAKSKGGVVLGGQRRRSTHSESRKRGQVTAGSPKSVCRGRGIAEVSGRLRPSSRIGLEQMRGVSSRLATAAVILSVVERARPIAGQTVSGGSIW